MAVRCAIGDVRSEPIVITVMKPEGLNAEAAKALNKAGLAEFFSGNTFNTTQVTEEKMQRLREFVDRFHDSLYADYATLGLGLIQLKGVEDEGWAGKPKYKPDLATAETYFAALSQSQGSVVKDRATYYLAVCRAKLGEMQAASAILNALKNQTADPVLRFKVEDRLRKKLHEP